MQGHPWQSVQAWRHLCAPAHTTAETQDPETMSSETILQWETRHK